MVRPARPHETASSAGSLGSLAVLAGVAAVAFGLPAVDRLMPATRPVPAGAYPVGGGVSVIPPPGAEVELTETRPGRDRGTALFLVAGQRLAIVVAPHRGDLDEATRTLQAKITREHAVPINGDPAPATTPQGIPGRRGDYAGGQFAVFVADDLAVEVTATGPGDEVGTVIRSLHFALPR